MSDGVVNLGEVTIDGRIDFKCPFCVKGECTAGYVGEDPVVVHTTPSCETFDRLDPIEFLSAVNKRRQN